ncbi:MAG: fasciclin domain-containing protein [Hyphomonadaceae bacterium]|nr:fasciclin domain-containing protein [Hyphomonadaceae bacterium]
MISLTRGVLAATLTLASTACMSDGMGSGMSASTSTSATASSSMPMAATPAVPPATAMAEKTVMVGGAAMYPSKNIIENAVNSADHKTLVAAVKAAGLVDTLSGPGPFTVFAPTDAAFARLPAGAVDGLLKPDMKATLQKVLTYHVVAGRMIAADISKAIQAGGGKATLTTVAGGTLTASMMGNMIMLVDAKGNMSHVTIGDVMQSNGVIHVVDSVLMPA